MFHELQSQFWLHFRFPNRRYLFVLVYPPGYLWEGGWRQEMRSPGVTKTGKRFLRLCWGSIYGSRLDPYEGALPTIQKSDFVSSCITANTRSQLNSPVLDHLTQTSLPLFSWETFYLLLPNHVMWDKCSNPYLWAFKHCDTAFTRQWADSKVDKLQSYSWPSSWLHSDRDLKLVLLIKRQTMTHRSENKQNQSVPCRMLGGSIGLVSPGWNTDNWHWETSYSFMCSKSCQTMVLPNHACP